MKQLFKQIFIFLIYIYANNGFAQYSSTVLHFDGINDFVELDDLSNQLALTNEFSVDVIIHPDAIQKEEYAIIFAINSRDISEKLHRFMFRLSGGSESSINTIVVNLPTVGQSHLIVGNIDVLDNECHRIVVTYKNDTTTLYIDGEFQGSLNKSMTLANDDRYSLGQEYDEPNFVTSQFYSGVMDNVRIWNRALDATEVESIQNGTEEQNMMDGLIAYYKMDDGIPATNNSSILTLSNEISSSPNGVLKNFSLTGTTSNFVTLNCRNILGNDINSFEENQLEIFPNPATEKLTIKSEHAIESVELINSIGEVIFKEKNNVNTIDVSSFQSGLYFLRIYSKNSYREFKIIKQ